MYAEEIQLKKKPVLILLKSQNENTPPDAFWSTEPYGEFSIEFARRSANLNGMGVF